jgi:hypothetical protein
MAIGVVSAESFDREMRDLGIVPDLEHHVNEEVRALVRGRGNKPEVPMAIRALVATEKLAGAPAELLADEFNISESSVSAYGNGATSTSSYDKKEPEIVAALDKAEERIIGRAQHKLLAALDSISEVKLKESKPNIASAVARDMSNIVRNMKPEAAVNVQNNRIVVFRPRLREEDEFESIQVIDE